MLFAQNSICTVRKCVLGLSALAFSLLLGSTTAFAANAGTSTYQQERAACLNGQSHQDRTTCLKEAAAARGEAKRGHLNDGAVSYDQNAIARCGELPAADRQDCVQRVRDGVVSGSVETGGIYRETTTTIVTPPAQPDPMPPAQEYQPMPAGPGTRTQ